MRRKFVQVNQRLVVVNRMNKKPFEVNAEKVNAYEFCILSMPIKYQMEK